MLLINGVETAEFLNLLPSNSVQKKIANQMNLSYNEYFYADKDLLEFELKLRAEITVASRKLYDSNFSFAVFRDVSVNEEFWNITKNGGMELKQSISSFDAMQDILKNSTKYATECATAMVVVYYLALCEVYGKEIFDKSFEKITLMNWHKLNYLISEVGQMNIYPDQLIGDRLYFLNPSVSPKSPQWQGENVIDLTGNTYYGHGIGIHKAEFFVDTLNRKRSADATESAYLMQESGRPNFSKLYNNLKNNL